MNVLLLSAYAARSHVYWQERLQEMFQEWHWQILQLPPRYFSWRVRGNPLYWALAERDVLEQDYDLLIATSMVDLATLRGLVPKLACIPSLLYFHENQFAYPQDRQRHSLLEAQMVSLYSALAADRIVFNSEFNRRSFFDGCAQLLERLPDKIPPGIVAVLREKASVLPVPLKPVVATDSEPGSAWPSTPGHYPERALRLVWVGRFEHDKGGDGLYLTLRNLEQTGLNFELAVIGQQFRESPQVFADIEREFRHRLVQFGYVESAIDYRKFLSDADIVLSTARHEFQGLAVLEAVTVGCLPAVPNRLVYPEIFPPRYCYNSVSESPEREADAAATLICRLANELSTGNIITPDVKQFSQDALQSAYRSTLLSLRRTAIANPPHSPYH